MNNDKAQHARLLAAIKKPKAWVSTPMTALPVIAGPIEGATARRVRKQLGGG
jgi:hypothetical protein